MFTKIIKRLLGRSIKPGSVVVDRYSGTKKTVERVNGAYADLVWFEGSTLRRGQNLLRNLSLA